MNPPEVYNDPPPGAPWDGPIADCPFACIDCEMTGPDPERDALVEVAVTRVVGGRVVGAMESLVRSEVPCAEAAYAVHGIAAVEIERAPGFGEVAGRLCELIEGAVVVAHGAELDVEFLNRALAACGRSERLEHVLDTLNLARRALHSHTYTLSALGAKLALGGFRWHRAGEDSRAVAVLLGRLLEVYRPPSARELWDVRVGQRGPVRVRASFDALFAKVVGTGRGVKLLVRTPGREPFVLRGRVERWTRPHLLLAQGPKGRRGLRTLRADRVLDACEE